MLRIGIPVSNHRLAGQFGMSLAYLDLLMGSLMKHLIVERDHQFFRLTKGAEAALKDFETPFDYVPFEGRPEW